MRKLPLDTDSFREVASRYATGVVVVTTTADGFDHAMTATSFTTVSLDPMMVLICVEKDTRFHDAIITPGESGVDSRWGISVLPHGQEPVASWFATKGRPLHGQFDRFPHHRGELTGVILLDAAIATVEVMTCSTVSAGDHTIVLGSVQSLAVESAEPEMPLTYWARRYRNLAP